MKIVLFIFCLLTGKAALAQFDFAPDTISFPSFGSRTVDSLFNLSKDFDFELRLSVNPSLLPGRQLFVLSAKDLRWSLRCFEFSRDDTTFTWKERFSTREPTELWREIQEKNPLHLLSEDELTDSDGNELQLGMYDGVFYAFELKNKKGERHYYYRCPKAWQKKYPHIKEFKRASDIIDAFYASFAKVEKIRC